MNIYSKKGRRKFATIIAIILVAAMVLPMILEYLIR